MTRHLLEQFEEHRAEGLQAHRVGDGNNARYHLLKAAEYLFRLAEESKGRLRTERVRKAERLLKTASAIEPGMPHEKVREGGQGEKTADGGDGESRWIVTRKPGIRFDDVAGLEDVKAVIRRRVIYPFVHPEITDRYKKKSGGGVLLYGPPGTGKTMIAKAIATELEATFFSIRCSDIMSKWVGEAEQNLQRLFTAARACPRAVLFLDETEAIVARRGGTSTVMNRVIPEFLAQVDGVDTQESSLLLLGATNRPWDMDEAALRTGRFGELIYVGPPDFEARYEILRRALEGIPMSDDVDLEELARDLNGFSGADIVGVVERIKDKPYDREIQHGLASSRIEPEDAQEIIANSKPSLTKAQLKQYEAFRKMR